MQNMLSGTDKQATGIKTWELCSVVIKKYIRHGNMITFDTFLQSFPQNLLWSEKNATYVFQCESSCHKMENISY
jgi:hypothetical protein